MLSLVEDNFEVEPSDVSGCYGEKHPKLSLVQYLEMVE